MAKVMTTIFKIAGEMDGSLIKALSTAQNALRGLNKTTKAGLSTSGKAQQGYLGLKLQELQRLTATLDKFKAAQTAAAAAMQKSVEAQSKQTTLRNEYAKAAQEATRLKERLKEVEKQRAQARSGEDKARATMSMSAAQADYRAQLTLKAQAYAAYRAGELRSSNLNAAYQRQNAVLRQLQGSLSAAGITVQNMASAEARLRDRINETTAVMTRQAGQRYMSALKANNTVGQHLNDAWSNMSNAVTTAQSLIQPLVKSSETAMTFEAELSRTRALTQMDRLSSGNEAEIALANERVELLREKYMEIGRTTKFSATEAAAAGNFMAMAGMSDEVILQGLKPIVNLANSTGTSFEQTADIITNVMTAFGEDWNDPNIGKKITEYADKMTYGTTHANMTLGMLGETLKYAAPIARGFGTGISESIAMAKFSHDAGVQASMAGTSMRSMFLRLSAPPKAAMEVMEKNGIVMSDAMKKWMETQDLLQSEGFDINAMTPETESELKRGFFDFAKQWDEKMSGKSSREQLAMASAMFGKNAASGAVNILNATSQGLAEFTDKLDQSQGAAEQTASVMMDNAKGSWISLQSALESLSISVGNAFLPAIRPLLDAFTNAARAAAQFAEKHPAVIQALGGLASAIASIIVALGGFRLALTALNFAKTSLELMRATSAFGAVSKMATAANIAGALTGQEVLFGATAAAGKAGAAGKAASAASAAAKNAMPTVVPPIAPSTVSNANAASKAASKAGAIIPPIIPSTINTSAVNNAASASTAASSAASKAGAIVPPIIPPTINTSAVNNAAAASTAASSAASKAGAIVPPIIPSTINTSAVNNAAAASTAASKAASKAGAIIPPIIPSTINTSAVNNAAAASTAASKAVSNVPPIVPSTVAGTTVANAGAKAAATSGATSAASVASGGLLTKLAPYMKASGWANIGTAISTTFTGAFSKVLSMVSTVKASMASFNLFSALEGGFNFIMGAGARLIGVFRAITSFAFSPLTAGIMAVGLVLSSVVTTVQSSWSEITSFFQAIGEQLSNTFSTAFESLQPAIGRVSEAWGQLQAAFGEDTALGQAIASLQDAIGNGLVSAVMAAVQIFADFVSTGVMMFTAILDAALNFTATLVGLFAAVFQGDIPGILNGIPAVFGAAFEGARAIAEAALSGILSLVQSIASAISSISFSGLSNAVAGAQAAAASVSVAHNASGGIYPRGEFLTTFAESSPEAAIPIDGSKNAIELWTRTGELLGVFKEPQAMSQSSVSMFRHISTGNVQRTSDRVSSELTLSTGQRTSGSALRELMQVWRSSVESVRRESEAGWSLESRLKESARLESEENNLRTNTTNEVMPAPITLHFHFEGNVNREDVRRGVEETMPRLRETFEEQMARYKHEVSRRAF